jgi:hypothetical protein
MLPLRLQVFNNSGHQDQIKHNNPKTFTVMEGYSNSIQCENNPSSSYNAIKHIKNESVRSRDSVVDIATGYGLDDRGVGVPVPVKSRILFSLRRPGQFWGPRNTLSSGYRGLFPRGICTSTLPYAFIAQCSGTTLLFIHGIYRICILVPSRTYPPHDQFYPLLVHERSGQ